MLSPLDSARAKLRRAEEHEQVLGRTLSAFSNSGAMKFYQRFTGATLVLGVRLDREPPAELGLVAGDILTNLRASLDHAMYEVAKRQFTPEFDDARAADRRLAGFPIGKSSTDDDFVRILSDYEKRNVAPGIISLVTSVQRDHDDTLWCLNEMVNRDKHRHQLLTVGFANAHGVTVRYDGQREMIFEGRLEHNEVTVPLTPEMRAALEANRLSCDIISGAAVMWADTALPRRPIIRLLDDSRLKVCEVIDRLEPLM